jgi:valyl-tRNA synthetase
MDFVLSAILRLLHPFMPHLTEELWSLMAFGKSSIQFAAPPQKLALDDASGVLGKRKVASAVYEAAQAGRNLRSESKLPSNKKIRFILRTHDNSIFNEIPTLTRLLNAEEVVVDAGYEPPTGTPVAITRLGEIFLPVTDTDVAHERERLDKEIAKIESELRTVESKLENRSFVDRAPAAIVEEHRQRLKDLTAQFAKLIRAREGLS